MSSLQYVGLVAAGYAVLIAALGWLIVQAGKSEAE